MSPLMPAGCLRADVGLRERGEDQELAALAPERIGLVRVGKFGAISPSLTKLAVVPRRYNFDLYMLTITVPSGPKVVSVATLLMRNCLK